MKRKPISKSEIQRFIYLSSHASYNFENKEEYKTLGRKILRYIAQEMDLKDGEYEIRWNPGGIAVSGDHILHTSKVYLALHDNLNSGWFYYRSCNGLRDYTGRANQVTPWRYIENGLGPLIQALKIMHNGYKDSATGDIVFTKPIVERQALACLREY